MSYRNPQIFFADPSALQRGFDAGFSSMQAKFEKERLEKERIAKEQDEALAGAYNTSDLSGIANLDTRIMDGLQKSIDSIIDDGSFATASASEQAKMIRQVSTVKNTVARLGELAGIDPKDWDSRNSAKLSALKSALTRGDKSVNIVGKGLDLKIVGDFGEITLDELASARFMNKTDFRDEYNKMTSTFKKEAFKYMENAAKAGTEIEEDKLRNIFASTIREEGDPEFWSYLFSNETNSTMKGRFYGDPEAKKVYGDDFESIQFTEMSDDLFKKVIGSVYDSAELRGYYQRKNTQESSKSDGTGKELSKEELEKKADELFDSARTDFSTVLSRSLNKKAVYDNKTGQLTIEPYGFARDQKKIKSEREYLPQEKEMINLVTNKGKRERLYEDIFDSYFDTSTYSKSERRIAFEHFMNRVRGTGAYASNKGGKYDNIKSGTKE